MVVIAACGTVAPARGIACSVVDDRLSWGGGGGK